MCRCVYVCVWQQLIDLLAVIRSRCRYRNFFNHCGNFAGSAAMAMVRDLCVLPVDRATERIPDYRLVSDC